MDLPIIYETPIKQQWLDYNDHLNVAYYVLIFDMAGETLIRTIGMGQTVTQQTGISWVVLENHITYQREVVLGQTAQVAMQLLDYDHKRLHLYLEMRVSGNDPYLAATLEQMIMCVDLNTRRSTNFPHDVLANIKSMRQSQIDLPKPRNIGRTIGIRR